MKKNLFKLIGIVLPILAVCFGVGHVAMAMAMDAGATIEGAATISDGSEVTPELYDKTIDQRITKIRPMSTPIDQISRSGDSLSAESFIVKYYSVGTRPIKAKLSTLVAAQTTGNCVAIVVDDPAMFTEADTIRVVGVKGYSGENNTATKEDLILFVKGKEENTGNIVVYAVNGKYDGSTKQNILLPAISANATLVRLGKACGELDVQTAVLSNIPTPEEQYCQNFMIQVEQSTFDAITAKEVDWNFSDLEEDGIYDMRLGQEGSFLFGYKAVIKHPSKQGKTYFTGGIWWQAGKDVQVGNWDADTSTAVVTDDDLVEMAKALFVGTDTGNKQKVLFCGSDMLAALSKCKTEKFIYKDTVEAWGMKFKSFDTEFGEVLVMHHEMFDLHGMADQGICIDPVYITKRKFITWTRNILDLKKAGVRNTEACVLQEVSCVYLRYPKAHARMALASA